MRSCILAFVASLALGLAGVEALDDQQLQTMRGSGEYKDVVSFFDNGLTTLNRYRELYPADVDIEKIKRLVVQIYRTTDDIVNPLDINGLPTGDDIALTNLNFNWAGSPFMAVNGRWKSTYFYLNKDSNGLLFSGDKVYLRVFNWPQGPLPVQATKYMEFLHVYQIPSVPSGTYSDFKFTFYGQVDMNTANLGWSGWKSLPTRPKDVIITNHSHYPTLNVIDRFDKIEAIWKPDTSGFSPKVAGYRISLGRDAEATSLFYNVDTSDTSFRVGPLEPDAQYYCKIIPYTRDGVLGLDTPSFTFTTRPLIRPAPAIKPSPIINAPITVDRFPANLTIRWSPSVFPVSVDGYLIFMNGRQYTELGQQTSCTLRIDKDGVYTWQAVPFHNDDGRPTYKTEEHEAGIQYPVKALALENNTWSFDVRKKTVANMSIKPATHPFPENNTAVSGYCDSLSWSPDLSGDSAVAPLGYILRWGFRESDLADSVYVPTPGFRFPSPISSDISTKTLYWQVVPYNHQYGLTAFDCPVWKIIVEGQGPIPGVLRKE